MADEDKDSKTEAPTAKKRSDAAEKGNTPHSREISIFATILHAQTGWLNYSLAAHVLLGAIPGVLIGARLATVIPDRPMRGVLAVVLASIGAVLLVQGPKKPAPPTAVVAAVASPEVIR